MGKQDSKVDQYPLTVMKLENTPAIHPIANVVALPEDPVRLSVRGAVRETGTGPLSSFEVKIDLNSSTGRYEKDQLLIEQLENVDFYIEQGFLDVALSTLERLEVVFPDHPLITERLDRMAHAEKNGDFIELITSPATTPVANVPAKAEANQANEDKSTNATSSRGESTVPMIFAHTVSHGMVTPLAKPADSPIDKPNFEPVPKLTNTMRLGLASLFDSEESTEEMYQTISDEEDTQSNLLALASSLNFNSILEEIDSEPDLAEDFQTHFNVGQAYFDIELFDDAIEEFQVAYRIIQALETHPQSFQCSFMLGRCFHIKEMVRPALMWIRRALSTKSAIESELLDAKYELANIHEELGESALALELYEQIAKTQPNFKDVADRMILLSKTLFRR